VRQDLDIARRTGTAPRVNLLPVSIVRRRLVRRQRLGSGAGLLVLLVLLALLWAAEAGRADRAGRVAAREEAATAALQAQRAKLQPWAELRDQVDGLERLQAAVYAKEIRFSGVLQDVSTLVPGNAWLTQMSVAFKEQPSTAGTGGSATGGGTATTRSTQQTSGQAAGSAVFPGAPGDGAPVATVTLSGEALGHVDVGGLVRTLNAAARRKGQRVYLNPFFTTSQRQQGSGQAPVTFAATVDLGQAAYSGRFQQPDQPGGK